MTILWIVIPGPFHVKVGESGWMDGQISNFDDSWWGSNLRFILEGNYQSSDILVEWKLYIDSRFQPDSSLPEYLNFHVCLHNDLLI